MLGSDGNDSDGSLVVCEQQSCKRCRSSLTSTVVSVIDAVVHSVVVHGGTFLECTVCFCECSHIELWMMGKFVPQ